MAEVTVEIVGAKEVVARLLRAEGKISQLQPAMSKIGTYLTGFFSGQVFASRGRVIGEPWRPLSNAYAAQKARRYSGRPPLVRTGLMQRSFKARTGVMSVRLFNTAGHFGYHQLGTRKMPARVMMKVDAKRQRDIGEIVATQIREALR